MPYQSHIDVDILVRTRHDWALKKNDLSLLVRGTRVMFGLSRWEFAQVVEVSEQTVSKWERFRLNR